MLSFFPYATYRMPFTVCLILYVFPSMPIACIYGMQPKCAFKCAFLPYAYYVCMLQYAFTYAIYCKDFQHAFVMCTFRYVFPKAFLFLIFHFL